MMSGKLNCFFWSSLSYCIARNFLTYILFPRLYFHVSCPQKLTFYKEVSFYIASKKKQQTGKYTWRHFVNVILTIKKNLSFLMKQFIFYGGCIIEYKPMHGPMNIFYINFQQNSMIIDFRLLKRYTSINVLAVCIA